MCKEERAGAHAHTPQTQHETLQTVNGRFHQSAAPRNLPNLNGCRLHVCPQTDECRLPRVWLKKTEQHGRCTIALKRSSISPIPNCAESAIKTGLNQSHNKTQRFRQRRVASPHPLGSLIRATIDPFIGLGAPRIGGSTHAMYDRICGLKDCWDSFIRREGERELIFPRKYAINTHDIMTYAQRDFAVTLLQAPRVLSASLFPQANAVYSQTQGKGHSKTQT